MNAARVYNRPKRTTNAVIDEIEDCFELQDESFQPNGIEKLDYVSSWLCYVLSRPG